MTFRSLLNDGGSLSDSDEWIEVPPDYVPADAGLCPICEAWYWVDNVEDDFFLMRLGDREAEDCLRCARVIEEMIEENR